MEELLHRISNSHMVDYMREALQCYNTGAYRGCIVLCCIALFDDCINKLSDIRAFNKKAKEIHDEVVRRQKMQDVFEQYLLDQLQSTYLISELDVEIIQTIKNKRNKSAHPSGHKPSAEEARYIYYEVIDKFLSKASFDSKVLVDEVLDRLGNNGFFPSADIESIVSVVCHEIKLLHSEAFSYLFTKLIERVIDYNNIIISRNATYFIDGLSYLDNPEWNSIIVTKILEKKLGDEQYHSLCLGVISLNPSLINEISETAINRLRQAIAKNTNETPNSNIVNSPAQLFQNFLTKYPAVLTILKEECVQFLRKHSYLSLSPLLAKVNSDLWREYQTILINKAGSITFDIANNFSKSFYIVEDVVVKESDEDYLLYLMLAIIQAAEGGAWGAASVVSEKFNQFSTLKNAVMNFVNTEKDSSMLIIKEKKADISNIDDFIKQYLN